MITKEKFIEHFIAETDGDLWQYEDNFDYSKGMKPMDKESKIEIATELYNRINVKIEIKDYAST